MTSAHVVDPPKILGIGGSIRARSAGESALRYCLGMAEHAGAVVEIMTARDLALPMYDPSVGASVTGAEHFLDSVNRADALLIATPAYHAGPSGVVKNALDHLEELRDADRPYLDGKAVGCIATSRGPQGGALTLASLRSIVHALRGWPTPLGAVIDTTVEPFTDEGEPVNTASRAHLRTITEHILAATTRTTS